MVNGILRFNQWSKKLPNARLAGFGLLWILVLCGVDNIIDTVGRALVQYLRERIPKSQEN